MLEQTLKDVEAGVRSHLELREVLSASTVVVPGLAERDADGNVDLPVLELSGGARAVPLFSSYERMRESGGPSEGSEIAFDALSAAWPGDVDAVLDPGSPWALLVPAAAMGESADQARVPAGTEVALAPAGAGEVPDGLLPALRDALVGIPTVAQAWAVHMRQSGLERLVLAFGGDGIDEGALHEALGPVVGPYLAEVDIQATVLLKADDDWLPTTIRSFPAFFER